MQFSLRKVGHLLYQLNYSSAFFNIVPVPILYVFYTNSPFFLKDFDTYYKNKVLSYSYEIDTNVSYPLENET
jgi:hypothetical protein